MSLPASSASGEKKTLRIAFALLAAASLTNVVAAFVASSRDGGFELGPSLVETAEARLAGLDPVVQPAEWKESARKLAQYYRGLSRNDELEPLLVKLVPLLAAPDGSYTEEEHEVTGWLIRLLENDQRPEEAIPLQLRLLGRQSPPGTPRRKQFADNKRAELLTGLALNYQRTGNFAEAAARMREALQLYPAFSPGFEHRYREILRDLGKSPAEIKAEIDALRASP